MILPEFFDSCDHCGEPFERDTTYPVLTTTEAGDMRLFSFCDDQCLARWSGETVDGYGDDEAEA